MGGDADSTRLADQLRAHGRATDRDQRQRLGCPLLGSHQVCRPGVQHLGQQDHAVRAVPCDHRLEARGVETRSTAQTDLAHRQRDADRAVSQRGPQAGQVLQQHRVGQCAQVSADVQRRHGLPQPVDDPLRGLRAQAHALGLAGGAGGVGDLGRACGHRDGLRRQAQQPQGLLCEFDLSCRRVRPCRGHLAGGEHRIDPGRAQRVGDLRQREERGQRHVHQGGLGGRQVGHHPGRRVVQQGGQHARSLRAQVVGKCPHLLVECSTAPGSLAIVEADGRGGGDAAWRCGVRRRLRGSAAVHGWSGSERRRASWPNAWCSRPASTTGWCS